MTLDLLNLQIRSLRKLNPVEVSSSITERISSGRFLRILCVPLPEDRVRVCSLVHHTPESCSNSLRLWCIKIFQADRRVSGAAGELLLTLCALPTGVLHSKKAYFWRKHVISCLASPWINRP